jgi:hypothetical protein
VGLVVGIAMVKSGLTIPQALGMTLLVFAGSPAGVAADRGRCADLGDFRHRWW